MNEPAAASRPLNVIAAEIESNWKQPYFGALPYIIAMMSLSAVTDRYGAESGQDIIAYFLANAGKWRGETARRIKAELRSML